jgi:hypothetical protein
MFTIPETVGSSDLPTSIPRNGGDILDIQAAPFLTYDLISPIGPIVGSFADYFSLNNPSATSAGDLILTAVGDDVIVRASAVPEPSSVTLIAVRRCRRAVRRRGPEETIGDSILAAA